MKRGAQGQRWQKPQPAQQVAPGSARLREGAALPAPGNTSAKPTPCCCCTTPRARPVRLGGRPLEISATPWACGEEGESGGVGIGGRGGRSWRFRRARIRQARASEHVVPELAFGLKAREQRPDGDPAQGEHAHFSRRQMKRGAQGQRWQKPQPAQQVASGNARLREGAAKIGRASCRERV